MYPMSHAISARGSARKGLNTIPNEAKRLLKVKEGKAAAGERVFRVCARLAESSLRLEEQPR
jgi:hypothetical protein